MIRSPDLTALLDPLERFDALHAATLRRHGQHAIDLSYPNPHVAADPRPYRLLAELAGRVTAEDLRYSPFGGFTAPRRRVAAALKREQQLPYTWRHVLMTAGASGALALVLEALLAAPARVALLTPCWMDYPLYLTRLGLGVDMVAAGPGKRLDIAALAAALTEQTRAVILAQPVSPTGVVHDGEDLEALATLLREHSATCGTPTLLIADQAHRDQTWEGTCPPPAAYYPQTATVYSFGKAWDMQGQRVGYLAVSPNVERAGEILEALRRTLRISGQCAPTALMQHLAAELVDLQADLAQLRGLQYDARTLLRDAGLTPVPAVATRFLYLPCPAGEDEWAFTEALAATGVLVMPSGIFHEPGYLRVSLTAEPRALERALGLITRAVVDA